MEDDSTVRLMHRMLYLLVRDVPGSASVQTALRGPDMPDPATRYHNSLKMRTTARIRHRVWSEPTGQLDQRDWSPTANYLGYGDAEPIPYLELYDDERGTHFASHVMEAARVLGMPVVYESEGPPGARWHVSHAYVVHHDDMNQAVARMDELNRLDRERDGQ